MTEADLSRIDKLEEGLVYQERRIGVLKAIISGTLEDSMRLDELLRTMRVEQLKLKSDSEPQLQRPKD